MTDVFTWPVGRAVSSKNRRPAAAPVEQRPPAAPIAVYFGASTAGGALIGTILGLVGQAVHQAGGPFVNAAAVVVLLVIAAAAVGLEAVGKINPLPQRRAQVPRSWAAWKRRELTAAAFGLMIGSGFLTYLNHATAYALGVLVLLAPTLEIAILLGASYGAARGVSLVATWLVNRYLGRELPWNLLLEKHLVVSRFLALAGGVALTGSVVVSVM